ncbi:MAG: iron-sulfur cluster repair protein YtfE [Planctomycetes bacterium]|nr:iron-sulfur cluster repair protein YtfE [Planctomycetota bacterium]
MTHSTAPIRPDTTLADLATTHAGASRVFHRHGLDFCCHGRISLAKACAEHKLDLDALLSELRAEEQRTESFEQWDERALPQLVEHLLANFHLRHREELPRLIAAARKVESVHGEKSSCPKGLAAHLEHMAEELEDHMQKEEQVLFPMVLAGRGAMAAMPVQVLEMEHNDHALNLQRSRALAHGFVPPSEACGTWRALYLGLEAFERDVMQHIHLENNVLFPRTLRS